MLTEDSVVKIYDRWGRFYDIVFKWIFSEGRNAGAELLNPQAGESLREVGVGTGLSLPLYRKDARIAGIDVSSKMLEKAQDKVDKLGLKNVALKGVDAQATE